MNTKAMIAGSAIAATTAIGLAYALGKHVGDGAGTDASAGASQSADAPKPSPNASPLSQRHARADAEASRRSLPSREQFWGGSTAFPNTTIWDAYDYLSLNGNKVHPSSNSDWLYFDVNDTLTAAADGDPEAVAKVRESYPDFQKNVWKDNSYTPYGNRDGKVWTDEIVRVFSAFTGNDGGRLSDADRARMQAAFPGAPLS